MSERLSEDFILGRPINPLPCTAEADEESNPSLPLPKPVAMIATGRYGTTYAWWYIKYQESEGIKGNG
jgi:hypothetical protein